MIYVWWLAYSGFEKSLSWAAGEVFKQTDQRVWAPILELASKIRLNDGCKTCECLLEFHHNDHLVVDVSFGIPSSEALLPKNFMPLWWESYVDRCDQCVPYKSFSEGINATNTHLQYRKRNTAFSCALPDFHYLEFDFLKSSFRLSGIFQRLDCVESEVQPQMLNEILDYCVAFQEIPNRTSECQQMFKDLFESLGCPYWIGLMIGRGDLVKLVFQSSGSLENTQPGFWHWFSKDFRLSYENTTKYLSSIEQTSVRCCLDLSLSKPNHHPRLCFEIFPASQVKESTSWAVLNSLKNHFNLEEDLILQIRNLYSDIPRGMKKTPFSHIYSCPEPPFNKVAAIFSHYKICLEKDQPLELKTYAHIVAEL